MATVRPFRGVRYAPERVDLSLVLAPAAAVDEDAHAALLAREPRNATRVVACPPRAGEAEDVPARRAALHLAEWRRAGVLVEDEYPSLYVLRQTLPAGDDGEERVMTGFFAALRLDAAAKRDVREHEATDPGAVDSLCRYLATVGVHTDPVLLLHRDEGGRVERALSSEMEEREPDVRARVDDVSYELWVVDDETTAARVSRHLEDQPLYLADGHHRFQAALALEEMRAQGHGAGVTDKEPMSVIALFVSMEEARHGVAPIHRRAPVPDGFEAARALGELGPWFSRRPVERAVDLLDEVRGSRARLTFGLSLPGVGAFVLEAREEVSLDELPGAPTDARADAFYVEPVLLRSVLGLDAGAALPVHDEELRRTLADEEPDDLVVICRPPSLDDVIALADEGAVLPEKSTSFAPKPPRGVVFCPVVAFHDDGG